MSARKKPVRILDAELFTNTETGETVAVSCDCSQGKTHPYQGPSRS